MKRILKAIPAVAVVCLALAGLFALVYVFFDSLPEHEEHGAGWSVKGEMIQNMYAELNNVFGDMDSYGGAYEYHDAERHVCIVLLKDPENENDKSKILDIAEHDDLIVFEKCEYSMKYLLDLHEKVNKKIPWFSTLTDSMGADFYLTSNYVNVYYRNRRESTFKLLSQLQALDTEGSGDAVKMEYRP